MSNDDENNFPLSVKKFPIGQSDESNHHDISQHNRREFLYFSLIKKVNPIIYIRSSKTSRTIFKYDK